MGYWRRLEQYSMRILKIRWTSLIRLVLARVAKLDQRGKGVVESGRPQRVRDLFPYVQVHVGPRMMNVDICTFVTQKCALAHGSNLLEREYHDFSPNTGHKVANTHIVITK
jgi:hypothetical protein